MNMSVVHYDHTRYAVNYEAANNSKLKFTHINIYIYMQHICLHEDLIQMQELYLFTVCGFHA
jgi:hypothetical protein